MNKWMFFGAVLFIGLGGCASHRCDVSAAGSECRSDYLLYQNDMLQAKWIINERRQANYELASALLNRAARQDKTGEAEFYQAILLIRSKAEDTKVHEKLQDSADHQYPLAIALLAQRAGSVDQEKARGYRAQYDKLDVAKSGYPSFQQALVVVNGLIAPNP
ncbi:MULTISPECIES: hypothetical protein [unclassified Pseudomonas]|uniref:hypothetical protein n=1 Tax=unclassified Pseudomonas TaxID=196821 RepID=UPI000D33626B|nr:MULTISPECIES: hypothetical protein [unclassified Pseudomonas]RAU47589.1 hypothetical protein DBP26_008020 [Pseudomonas sp. RIT 409]RAU49019.1 hypothetical protein DBY65_023745 [Pseudomonas sp. RIT 412]